jgi:VIT1/CCC1 family predicted Fe2+/Mn2+ transporter
VLFRSERTFLMDEITSYSIYSKLVGMEGSKELKRLFKMLADKEKEHINIWKTLLRKAGGEAGRPRFLSVNISVLLLIKKMLGVAFVIKLLERSEKSGFINYKMALSNKEFSEEEKRRIRAILKDESEHERALVNTVIGYKGALSSTHSVILGLNDGLVEILALVAGLATVATTSLIVVVVGMIAGISGTLSMSGGVYLSSKSSSLVEGSIKERKSRGAARKEAYYTGLYYFIGALIVVLPFVIGLGGTAGILTSILLVSVSLIAASAVIAVISDTSIRRRSLETLVISLGAATATILFSTLVKTYLGVRI